MKQRAYKRHQRGTHANFTYKIHQRTLTIFFRTYVQKDINEEEYFSFQSLSYFRTFKKIKKSIHETNHVSLCENRNFTRINSCFPYF